jgi:hypothetical protein
MILRVDFKDRGQVYIESTQLAFSNDSRIITFFKPDLAEVEIVFSEDVLAITPTEGAPWITGQEGPEFPEPESQLIPNWNSQ